MLRVAYGCVICVTLFLTLAGGSKTEARAGEDSKEGGSNHLAALPDSAGGLRLEAFLDALETSDPAAHRAFIEQHYAPRTESSPPIENSLRMLSMLQGMTGGVIFDQVVLDEPTSIRALVRNKKDGAWRSIQLELDPKPPHGITSIGLMVAEDPADAPPAGLSDEEIVAELQARLEKLVAADEFSGTVLLAKNSTTLFQHAYGLASQRFGVPNQIDTKLNLGSMNKMFTGLAIAQLAERGQLSFEDTVGKHLPDFPNSRVANEVTIHHLLTHTSGMDSYWEPLFETNWTRLRTLNDLLPLFAEQPLQFDPGQRFHYSNSGYIVLGLIIEAVTGQSYSEYVREKITGPAGMSNTDCYEMDQPVPNLAIGYTRMTDDHEEKPGPRRNNLFLHTARGASAGGGYSTVEDLLRFSVALKEHTLLSPEFTEILLTGKVEMGPGFKYAYGFGDHQTNGVRSVGHNGGAPGISADFKFFPQLGYTIAVLSNYDGAAHGVSQFLTGMITTR